MTFKSNDYDQRKHDWSNLDRWSLRLAVTLLKEDYPIYRNGIVSGTWSDSHQAIYEIAQDSIDLGGLKQLKDEESKEVGECVDPTEFVKWADSRGYKIPENLSVLLKNEGKKKALVQDKAIFINEKRSLVLLGWLTAKNFDLSKPLEITQSELWGELSKANNKIFPPSSPETIKGFFKEQNLCKFKTGRRKG
ncbi:MAG: hypothetical protein HOM14_19350 [Gammaproteobacteria bacterium]|jgi:hypothetical protein|nr:hypothetical protein [Gammaproteobacteria bacterium]MBT3722569.1 hypothetical protein [Gammaproteobacteria bacterium]MBT4196998.1 hypothetical protein [Gammaproteobacteria bacterium]MBT4451853.1 hypothetical protein [Gammaproteobacteria bacterium]MBT4860764.1 hypothetical protein [Gammaproteobacteria bacterium]